MSIKITKTVCKNMKKSDLEKIEEIKKNLKIKLEAELAFSGILFDI